MPTSRVHANERTSDKSTDRNKAGCALLTIRESEIVELLRLGKTTKEIADVLNLSFHTVATHRKHLCKKMGAHSTAELIAYAHHYPT